MPRENNASVSFSVFEDSADDYKMAGSPLSQVKSMLKPQRASPSPRAANTPSPRMKRDTNAISTQSPPMPLVIHHYTTDSSAVHNVKSMRTPPRSHRLNRFDNNAALPPPLHDSQSANCDDTDEVYPFKWNPMPRGGIQGRCSIAGPPDDPRVQLNTLVAFHASITNQLPNETDIPSAVARLLSTSRELEGLYARLFPSGSDPSSIESVSKFIDDLQCALSAQNAQVRDLKLSLAERSIVMTELTMRVEENQRSLSDTKTQLETLQTSYQDCVNDNEGLRRFNRGLKTEMSALKTDNDLLKNSLSVSEAQTRQAEERVRKMENKLASKASDLQSAIATLEAELQSERQSRNESLKDATDSLNTTREENEQLSTELNRLSDANDELAMTLREHEAEQEQLEAELSAERERSAKLESEKSELARQLNQTQDVSGNRFHELNSLLSDATTQLQSKQCELENAKVRFAQVERELGSVRTQLNQVQAKHDVLQQQQDTHRKEINDRRESAQRNLELAIQSALNRTASSTTQLSLALELTAWSNQLEALESPGAISTPLSGEASKAVNEIQQSLNDALKNKSRNEAAYRQAIEEMASTAGIKATLDEMPLKTLQDQFKAWNLHRDASLQSTTQELERVKNDWSQKEADYAAALDVHRLQISDYEHRVQELVLRHQNEFQDLTDRHEKQMDEMQRRLSDLQRIFQSALSENARLNDCMSDLESQSKTLKSENKEMANENTALKERLKEKETECAKHTEALAQRHVRVERLQAEKRQIESLAKQLYEQLQNLQQAYDDVQLERAQVQKRHENEVLALKLNTRDLELQLTHARQQPSPPNIDASKLNQESRMDSKRFVARTDYDAITAQFRNLQNDHERMEAQMRQLRLDSDRLRNDLALSITNTNRLSADVEQKDEKILRLSGAMEQQQSQFRVIHDSLRAELHSKQSDIDRLQGELQRQSNRIRTSAIQRNANLSASLDRLTADTAHVLQPARQRLAKGVDGAFRALPSENTAARLFGRI